MPRVLLLPLLACALLPGFVSRALAQTVLPPGAVSATLEQCLSAGEQFERAATFTGEMTAVAGTARMAIRVEVQERMSGEELFHTVSAPGLGVWRDSDMGVKIYKYVKQVTNLSWPAAYRALVRYHWLGGRGQVIRRAERLTPRCFQSAPPNAASSLE